MSAADQPTIPQQPHCGLPRRTVIKGAAWSVPVIAAAVSIPLASASNVPPVATSFFAGIGSGLPAGDYAKAEVTGRVGRADGSIPAGTVITLSTPDGGEIVVDSEDQVGIQSIIENADGTYTIIPEPGIITVTFYVTRTTAGSITVLATAGSATGNANGNWS